MNSSILCVVLIFWQAYDTICQNDLFPAKVNLGYLYMPSVDGPNDSPFATIKTGEQRLKQNRVIPEYVEFDVHWSPTVCDVYNGTMEFIRLKEDHKLDVMLGPPCSQSADIIGELAVSYNLLCVSHRTDDYIFTNTALYQTYARTTRKDINQISGAVHKFLAMNGWTRVAMVAPEGGFYANLIREGVQFMFINGPKIKLTRQPIHVALDIKYDQSQLDLSPYLEQIKKTARIVILIMDFAMEGSANLMLQAHKANMTGPEWAWIFIDLSPKLVQLLPWETYDSRGALVDREDIKEAYRSALTFTDPNVALFDATYSYGTMLNLSVENGVHYQDGKGLFNLFAWQHIVIGFDAEALLIDGVMDLSALYTVEGFNRDNKYEVVWNVYRVKNESPIHYDYDFELVSTTFTWRTADNKPPLAIPICNFDGSLCIEDNSLPTWVWIVIALGVTAALGLFGYLYWRRMKELELQNLNWQIDHAKLVETSNKRATSRNSAGSGSILSDNATLGSQHTHINYQDSIVFVKEYLTCSLLTGTYDGQQCFIFKYETVREVRMNTEQLKMLKHMKAMNHENLGYFMGVAVSREDMVILWSRSTTKPLREVLENKDMPLDDDFLATFLRGVADGLKYIQHSGLGVHGHLTSETCTIDSRFVLKLTEFGMAPFLSHLAQDGVLRNELESYDLFHCAPEIMANAANGMSPGTKPADIYALAMVLYQIISRQKLFHDYVGTDEALITRIQDTQRLPMRPAFGNDIPLTWIGIINLVKECWAHNPDARPTIDMVHSGVTVATSQFKGNIVEKMIHRMERYTNDLEKVVGERTAEVHEQQERTERLLQQMLPKSVAVKLQAGIAVEPESYESATVLFTDIVKFTDMSANHTAFEIVALLNKIYTTFDDLIDQHDVYKVETIGDAYMVVSGVPNRTKKHASEIALLGLALRDYVRGFDMPFLEEEPLRIRLGAHTGPVASGVVGVKMPRFCLFGDTVHTASKIESNGIPLRLHVSEATKKALQGNSQFELALRGQIEIKGKGTHTTYFVEKKGK